MQVFFIVTALWCACACLSVRAEHADRAARTSDGAACAADLRGIPRRIEATGIVNAVLELEHLEVFLSFSRSVALPASSSGSRGNWVTFRRVRCAGPECMGLYQPTREISPPPPAHRGLNTVVCPTSMCLVIVETSLWHLPLHHPFCTGQSVGERTTSMRLAALGSCSAR